jgi:hypothetical protein
VLKEYFNQLLGGLTAKKSAEPRQQACISLTVMAGYGGF